MNGQALVGFEDFNAYTGPGSETGTKEFSGVRLLGDYTFSLTVSSDYYPSYFAYTNGAVQPYVLEQWLGKDVDIMDDGNGCYLTDNYYEMNGEDYVKAAEILGNRYNLDIPYSGPYVVSEWDEGTSQAVMTINPEYKGNFEGQKPSIETIVYSKIIEETQVAQLIELDDGRRDRRAGPGHRRRRHQGRPGRGGRREVRGDPLPARGLRQDPV